MVRTEVCYRFIAFSCIFSIGPSQQGKLCVQDKGIKAILKQWRPHPGKRSLSNCFLPQIPECGPQSKY